MSAFVLLKSLGKSYRVTEEKIISTADSFFFVNNAVIAIIYLIDGKESGLIFVVFIVRTHSMKDSAVKKSLSDFRGLFHCIENLTQNSFSTCKKPLWVYSKYEYFNPHKV